MEEITETHLNAAAVLLLSQLPEHAVELFGVIGKDYGLPIWQVVAGCLVSTHLEGRVSAFTLDPDWRDGFRRDELTCQWEPCGKTFPPNRIGQLYCCNECGLKANSQWYPTEDATDDTIQLEPAFEPADGRSTVPGGAWGGSAFVEDTHPVSPELDTLLSGAELPDNNDIEGVPQPDSGNRGWSTETGLD